MTEVYVVWTGQLPADSSDRLKTNILILSPLWLVQYRLQTHTVTSYISFKSSIFSIFGKLFTLFSYFLFLFSEGVTLPSTNTNSKAINELEKMLDTNKDTTGKPLSTLWTIYHRFTYTDHLAQFYIKQTVAV